MYEWPEHRLAEHLKEGSTEIEEGGEQFGQMTPRQELTFGTNLCTYICGQWSLLCVHCAVLSTRTHTH